MLSPTSTTSTAAQPTAQPTPSASTAAVQPQPTTQPAAQPVTTPAQSTPSTNTAAKDKKEITLSNQIPTLDRVFFKAAGLPAPIPDPSGKTPQDQGVLLSKEYVRVIATLIDTLEKTSDPKVYNANKELLEGPLPKLTDDIDFTDTASIDKAVDSSLAALKKKKLEITGSDTALQTAIKAYIKMRIALGINNHITLEKLKEETEITQYIEALKRRENEALQIAAKGRSDDLSNIVIAQKPMGSERLGKMLQEETAKRVANGVYVNFCKDGKPFITLTEIDENSINKSLNLLKGNPLVTWHNLPPEKRDLATILSLKRGTRCIFVTGGGTPEEPMLSQAMPKPPDNDPSDWASWIQELLKKSAASPEWQKKKDTNLTTLIQEVVGNDPQQLREFWHNINENDKRATSGKAATPPTPLLGEVANYLSKEQAATLEEFYNNKISELNKKIISTNPAPSQIELARYQDQLATANTELQQLYQEYIKVLTNRNSWLYADTLRDTKRNYIEYLVNSTQDITTALGKINAAGFTTELQSEMAEAFYKLKKYSTFDQYV